MGYIECSSGGGGAETPTLLWTNPNPTAVFSTDTQVNYDTSKYKYIIAEYSYSTGYPDTKFRAGFDKDINSGGKIGLMSGDYIRPITFNSNGLSIFRASYTGGGVTSTSMNIPLKIYGLTKLPYEIS